MTRGIRSFTVVPYLFAEPHEARRILGLADGQATFWAVDLESPECAPAVRANLERHADLAVRDRGEFESMTSRYWVIGSGAGATLAFAALLGFIVGLVVVGQTLYSLTESRSRELATLKAMGASGRELAAFVLWQAGFLAIVGGAIGLVWAFGLGHARAPDRPHRRPRRDRDRCRPRRDRRHVRARQPRERAQHLQARGREGVQVTATVITDAAAHRPRRPHDLRQGRARDARPPRRVDRDPARSAHVAHRSVGIGQDDV